MKTKFTIMCILMSFSVISEAKVTYADVIADNAEHKAERIRQYEKKMQDPLATGPLEPGGMNSSNNDGYGEPIFISGADDKEWIVPSDGILALNGGDDKNSIINRTGGQFTTLCSGGAGSGCTAAVKKGWRVMFYVNGNYNYANAVFTPRNSN